MVERLRHTLCKGTWQCKTRSFTVWNHINDALWFAKMAHAFTPIPNGILLGRNLSDRFVNVHRSKSIGKMGRAGLGPRWGHHSSHHGYDGSVSVAPTGKTPPGDSAGAEARMDWLSTSQLSSACNVRIQGIRMRKPSMRQLLFFVALWVGSCRIILAPRSTWQCREKNIIKYPT